MSEDKQNEETQEAQEEAQQEGASQEEAKEEASSETATAVATPKAKSEASIEEQPATGPMQELKDTWSSFKEILENSLLTVLVVVLAVLLLIYFNTPKAPDRLSDSEEQIYAAFDAENPQEVFAAANATDNTGLKVAALIRAGDLYLKTAREEPYSTQAEKDKAMQMALSNYAQAATISKNPTLSFAAMIGTVLTLDEIGHTDKAIEKLEELINVLETREEFKQYKHFPRMARNYLRLIKMPLPKDLETIKDSSDLLKEDISLSLWDAYRPIPPAPYNAGPLAPLGPINYPKALNGG